MSTRKRFFRMLFLIFIVIPLLSSVFLYLVQDRLLFPFPKVNENLLQWARQTYPGSEVQLTTADNVKLHGWFVKNQSPKLPAPLLIYFGGNAEDVTSWLWDRDHLAGWSVLAFDYRGAGLSEGHPSEANLLKDALFLYDTFAIKPEVDKTHIVTFGRSLGTGMAVYLASQRPVQGVILVSPFDSIRSVAQRRYFFVPVFLLLKHPFDSLTLAPSIKASMLAIVATEDTLIPPTHSQRLMQAWGGKTFLKVITGADHNDIPEGEGYWESIKEFLVTLKSG